MDNFAELPRKSSAPYIRLDSQRWAENQKQLTSGLTRSLLNFLARKSDKYGCCWYAQRTLAEEIGFGVRTLRNHLKKLVDAGLVRKVSRTRGGQRVTNVYCLTGWPGRELLPASGHPVAGRHVVEDALSTLQSLAQKRHEVPVEAESGAVLNKGRESNTTTDAEKTAILDRCVHALGPWATEKNRRALTGTQESLFELFRLGHNLQRHVVPAIEAMVRDRRRIPTLNSWAYFSDAVARRAAEDAERIAPNTDALAVTGANESRRADPGEAKPVHDDPGIVSYLNEIARRKRVGSAGGDE